MRHIEPVMHTLATLVDESGRPVSSPQAVALYFDRYAWRQSVPLHFVADRRAQPVKLHLEGVGGSGIAVYVERHVVDRGDWITVDQIELVISGTC